MDTHKGRVDLLRPIILYIDGLERKGQGRRTLPGAKGAKPTWKGTCKGSPGLYSFYMKG